MPTLESQHPNPLINGEPMIEALRSVRYGVTDLALASQWYSQLLDLQPYLSSDTAVRYFVDGSWLELALDESPGPAGPLVYWGVDNLGAELLRLHQVGWVPHAPPRAVDATTRTATFQDPFGNVVGFMEVDDPGVLRAHSHRAAEKVALRNVRTVLDDLSVEERQQRKANRLVLAMVLVALLVGAVVLVSKLPGRQPENKIIIPIAGQK
ncbi:MAG: VOC family protein [Pseudomonadota bacterium]